MKKQNNKNLNKQQDNNSNYLLNLATNALLVAGIFLVIGFGTKLALTWLTSSNDSLEVSSKLTTQSSLLSRHKEIPPGKSRQTELSTGISSPEVADEVDESPRSTYKKVYPLQLSSARTIVLYGEIDTNALAAAEMVTDMANASDEPIYIVLSGPGGSVLTGSVLIAAMQASKAPVYTICSVMCASMDAMIHQYGKERYITDRTIMMFHPATAGTQGDIDRMYSMSKFLKRYTNKMEFEVSKRWHVSFNEYKQRTQTNLWIDAEDSVKQHIGDKLVSYSLSKNFNILPSQQEDEKHKINLNPDVSNPMNIKWICDDKCNVRGLKWLTSK